MTAIVQMKGVRPDSKVTYHPNCEKIKKTGEAPTKGCLASFFKSELCFFDELGFQLHSAEAVDLAVDVVIAFHQADSFNFCSDFQGA